jgi:uncharacterized protein involved in outer membrane biogenesis
VSDGDRPTALQAGPRRRRRVWVAGGLVLALLGLMLVALSWPRVAAAHYARRTGFDVGVERATLRPWSGRILLEGVRIDNPRTFGPREFLQVQRFRAEVQVSSLWSRRLVVEELTLDVPLIAIVTNTDGTTNLDLFRDRLAGPARGPASSSSFLIKRMHLRVGEIRSVNLSARQPKLRQMHLDLETDYVNVTEWQQLMTADVLRRLALAGGAFEALGPEDLGATLGNWARSGVGRLRDPARRSTETLKSLFEKLEETSKP